MSKQSACDILDSYFRPCWQIVPLIQSPVCKRLSGGRDGNALILASII